MKLASEIFNKKYVNTIITQKKINEERIRISKIKNRNINLNTTVYDFVEMESMTINEAFKKMKQNMFVVKFKDQYFVFDKADLIRTIFTGTGISYLCKNVSEALYFDESNIHEDMCFFKLQINFTVYIEINNFFKRIIEDQVVEILETDEILSSVISENFIGKGNDINYRFESLRAVNVDHCQAGSQRNVYKLQSLKNKDLKELQITLDEMSSKISKREIITALEIINADFFLNNFNIDLFEFDDEEEKESFYKDLHELFLKITKLKETENIIEKFNKEAKNKFNDRYDIIEKNFKIQEILFNTKKLYRNFIYFDNIKHSVLNEYKMKQKSMFLPFEIILSFNQEPYEYIEFEKTKNLILSEDQERFYNFFHYVKESFVPQFVRIFFKTVSKHFNKNIERFFYKNFVFTLESFNSLE